MSRTKDWLEYSEELKEIADLLNENKKFSWACFTYQQSSSAALKAILSKLGASTFGENLIALLRVIKKEKQVPKEIETACHKMNTYFKSSRDLEMKAEGTPSDYFSKKDADNAHSKALAILRFAHHEVH
jgi:HEPN domain-containing protein